MWQTKKLSISSEISKLLPFSQNWGGTVVQLFSRGGRFGIFSKNVTIFCCFRYLSIIRRPDVTKKFEKKTSKGAEHNMRGVKPPKLALFRQILATTLIMFYKGHSFLVTSLKIWGFYCCPLKLSLRYHKIWLVVPYVKKIIFENATF